tara:strand:- start:363 stop:836 length:474 start_codon:yes stop_codon:yes gene_type:complete
MKLFEFYGHALNSHKRVNDEARKGLHKFNIGKILTRDQFKTINELSSGQGSINWSSVKGSIRIKSTYTSLTKTIQTVFKLHNNVIFKWDQLKGYSIVLGDSNLWLSATTKRHINYLLRLLSFNFKYVTINNKPYLIGSNGVFKKPLELNNTYYLNDL